MIGWLRGGALWWVLSALCFPAIHLSTAPDALAGERDLSAPGLAAKPSIFVRGAPGSRQVEVTVRALIRAPVKIVWQTLVDYDSLGRSLSMFRVDRVAVLDLNRTRIDLILDLPWPLKDCRCPLEFAEDPGACVLHWHNPSGCSGKVQGSIHMEESGRNTVLTFRITILPDKAIPQFLIHWAFKQSMPRQIENIRRLVQER